MPWLETHLLSALIRAYKLLVVVLIMLLFKQYREGINPHSFSSPIVHAQRKGSPSRPPDARFDFFVSVGMIEHQSFLDCHLLPNLTTGILGKGPKMGSDNGPS